MGILRLLVHAKVPLGRLSWTFADFPVFVGASPGDKVLLVSGVGGWVCGGSADSGWSQILEQACCQHLGSASIPACL